MYWQRTLPRSPIACKPLNHARSSVQCARQHARSGGRMSRLLFAAMAGLVLLAGCGKKEESTDAPTGAEEAPPEITTQSDNPLKDMMAEAEKKKQDERDQVNRIRIQTW